jgi:putative ABC transport system permease protein
MWKELFKDQIALGLTQAVLVAALAIAVALIARTRRIRILGEVSVALVRGLAQVVVVGAVLVLLLRGPRWTSVLMLSAMVVTAATISAQRSRKIPGVFRISLYSIAVGPGVVIALMTAAGVIGSAVTQVVPIGSMLIANAMNSNSLAMNRFRADVEARVGEIESALALGASARTAVQRQSEAAFRSSLIPAIDSLRSLGIVWIPGLMAGMVLSGSPPIYAAIYQFVLIAMLFAASGLTCLVGTLLVRGCAFTPAEQLLLRPAGK